MEARGGIRRLGATLAAAFRLARPPARARLPARTNPPGRPTVLYDGACAFCTAAARRLARWAPPGAVELLSFQDPGVLPRFAGITHEACMRQMALVAADGRVRGGFEAAVRVAALRRPLGLVALAYYLPGVRQLCDMAYALVAANRYRLLRRRVERGECEEGACAAHLPPPPS